MFDHCVERIQLVDMFQCKQGGTATGVEGTAELYSLEGSGENPSNKIN